MHAIFGSLGLGETDKLVYVGGIEVCRSGRGAQVGGEIIQLVQQDTVNFVRLCRTRLGISRVDGIEDVIGKERLVCYGRRIKETRVLKGGNSPEEALRIKERVFRDKLRGR